MNERLKTFNDKMQKSFDYLKDDLASIRAGRANPHVLDKIKVFINTSMLRHNMVNVRIRFDVLIITHDLFLFSFY